MDNNKNDSYYVQKIIDYIDFCIENTKDVSKDEFDSNKVLLNAVMFAFVQISENASKLSDSYKKTHMEIPWIEIKGLRNIIVHDYEIVESYIVYDTVKNDLSELKQKILSKTSVTEGGSV